MDDVKCAIFAALIMTVAAEILRKVVYVLSKTAHHLKSGLLLLSCEIF